MTGDHSSRSVISVSGSASENFLQGLVSNNLPKNSEELIYAALLSPQGKFLFDFFIFSPSKDTFFIDIIESAKSNFLARLSMYKLRLELEIIEIQCLVVLSKDEFSSCKGHVFLDPRNKELGFRNYFCGENFFAGKLDEKLIWAKEDYELVRVVNCVPEFGRELISNETYILEANFEKISGVSFSKGCFVGQEVTARMKHKTKLRKGLVVVSSNKRNGLKELDFGAAIISGGKKVGNLLSVSNNFGIAYIKFDRVGDDLSCNKIRLNILD